MKLFLSCLLAMPVLIGACGGVKAAPAAARAETVLYVDTDAVLERNTMGFGVQWDPSDLWDYSDAQWQRLVKRVDFMRPQFIRCCLMADYYCRGLDAQGKPEYDWNSPHMKRLERILGYCQAHRVEVLLGEWGAPFGWKQDDPRWSQIIGDGLDRLIRDRGYTCIRWVNKINEPTGGMQAYLTWKSAQQSLHDEMKRRNLLGQVALVGPDYSEGKAGLRWVDYMLQDGAELFGAYETHWYAGSDSEIPNGDLETALRGARERVTARDPGGRAKRYFMGEAGTADWLDGKDSNRYIRDFAYGVSMSDYAAQTLRAGIAGVSAWMLDDPMHQQPGSYPPGGVPSGSPGVDFDFKVWGLWNSMGAAMGKPEDENLRPWFYSWSLLTRLFPRGACSVVCTSPHVRGVRMAAVLVPHGAQKDLSLIVVNNSDAPRRYRIVIPNARPAASLTEYRYFDTERPSDTDGFPVPSRTLRGVRLASGLEVSLPSRGVVFLTTMAGGSPLIFGTGARTPATWANVADPGETVAVGSTLRLTAETDPRGRPVRWAVSGMDGKPSGLAAIGADGTLRALKTGRVRVTASAGSVTAARVVELTRDRRIVDPLNDWDRTFSHTDNWVFDAINNQFFDGDPSRAKRTKDTPESIVYRCPRLIDFAARVYFTGDLEGKVRISVSPDNSLWSPVETHAEPAVATGAGFRRTVLRPVRLPAKSAYLKIEFANDPVIWSPQLAEMTLIAAGGKNPNAKR